MKKITLLLCALLLTAGVTKAGEYVAYQPSAPVAISNNSSLWTGVQLETGGKTIFPTLSENDVVKIHITNIATDAVAKVQFKVGDGWSWADIPDFTTDFDNGIISFTIKEGTAYWGDNNSNSQTFSAAEMAGWIKERGLIITGIHYKVLDITVQSVNVADDGSFITTLKDSHNTSNWSGEVIIKPGFKNTSDDYITHTSGDYITATVSLNENANEGKAWFRVRGGGENGEWPKLTNNGEVTINSGDEAKTVNIKINITDAELEAIDTYSLEVTGQNTTVANVQYHYTLANAAGYRPVYIPASGYATFSGASTCALPDGVNAYYVSSIADNKAMTTPLSNIPANQGVILEGAEGIYQLYATTDEPDAVISNLLTGVTTRTQITDVTNKYVLYNNNGTPEFRKINANTYLDPFKAYLNAPGAEARIALSFDNETNGIDELKQQTAGSKQMFDLQGRRVAKSTRGLYIVNGKKVFVK